MILIRPMLRLRLHGKQMKQLFIGTDVECLEISFEFREENGKDVKAVKFPSSYSVADDLIDLMKVIHLCIHSYICITNLITRYF